MNPNLIFDACRTGNLADVQQAHQENPDALNLQDAKGFTPLILAVYNNQPAVVDYLLQQGADVNAQDAAGNTALMGVVFKGYKDMAKKLLDAGAHVNLRNSNGTPALTFAATFGQLQIAEWLLQKGASIMLTDNRGKTALDHAVLQENEAMIALLKQHQMHQQ